MNRHRQTIKQCRAVARQMGIQCRFIENTTRASGVAYGDGRIMVGWCKRFPPSFISSIFCHEVNHVICDRNGKYAVYHWGVPGNLPRDIQADQLRVFIRTALKAERYVDKQGRKLHRILWPRSRYLKGYCTESGLKWFDEKVLEPQRERLRRLEGK